MRSMHGIVRFLSSACRYMYASILCFVVFNKDVTLVWTSCACFQSLQWRRCSQCKGVTRNAHTQYIYMAWAMYSSLVLAHACVLGQANKRPKLKCLVRSMSRKHREVEPSAWPTLLRAMRPQRSPRSARRGSAASRCSWRRCTARETVMAEAAAAPLQRR